MATIFNSTNIERSIGQQSFPQGIAKDGKMVPFPLEVSTKKERKKTNTSPVFLRKFFQSYQIHPSLLPLPFLLLKSFPYFLSAEEETGGTVWEMLKSVNTSCFQNVVLCLHLYCCPTHGRSAHWGTFHMEVALVIPRCSAGAIYSVVIVFAIQSWRWLLFGIHIHATLSNSLGSLISKL